MTTYPNPEELRGDLPLDVDPAALDWSRLEPLIKLVMLDMGMEVFDELTEDAEPIPGKPGQTLLDLELLPFDDRGFVTVRSKGRPFVRIHWSQLDPGVPPIWARPAIDA
jgi:hypothetical protein